MMAFLMTCKSSKSKTSFHSSFCKLLFQPLEQQKWIKNATTLRPLENESGLKLPRNAKANTKQH